MTVKAADSTVYFDAERIVRVIAIGTALVFGLGAVREVIIALVDPKPGTFNGDFFNLDGETNLPAWFSTVLLLAGGMTAAFVAWLARKTGEKPEWGWWALAVIFIYMSLDEMTSLHERTQPFFTFARPFASVFYFSWVVGAIPIVALIGALFIPFLVRLPRETAIRLLVAGAVYVFGAVGMEMVAGPVIQTYGRGYYYALCFMLEEGGEMAGVVLFLRALLYHIAENSDRLAFAVRRSGAP